MKRTILALVTVCCSFLAGEAAAAKKIGILQFSDELRYQESLRGIKDQLAKSGYREPGVTFVMGNAGGSKARAAELVQQFAGGHFDLMLTLGTNATIAVAKVIKDTPVVFCMVYDPVEARVAKDWKSSGTNATGSSPHIPMQNLVSLLRELKPVKRLAVLYTPGEKNSEIQLKEIQAVQESSGIRVLPVIVANPEDIAKTLPEVFSAVDAVYLSGSSVIGANVTAIVDVANRFHVISISHLEDHVGKGVLLGLGVNPYKLGELAGKKAVKVLKGARPSTIPIESLGKYDVLLNENSVRQGDFSIPASFRKKVTITIR